MCQPSVVADDWVKKGCHIHVDGVELSVAPDHLGGVVFQPVFSSTGPRKLKRALRIAREICLPDPAVRRHWIRSLKQASALMLGYGGVFQEWANGRMLEFKFLVIALERFEE
jgi:hypothetical protein